MIAFMRKVANAGDDEAEKWARMRVTSAMNLAEVNASSKMIDEWDFSSLLRDEGRRPAQAVLERHAQDLGRRSTLDLDVSLKGV